MNNQWKEYLQCQHAVLTDDENSVEHFGQPQDEHAAITTGNIICPISRTTFIHAAGDDAKTFLQGQLTNDISFINPQLSQLSGYCNPKGRLLALFRITQHADGYRLHFPESLLDKTIGRLKMFVLRAKVTLEAADADVVRFGIAGDQAITQLGAYFSTLPDAENGVVEADGITVIRHPGHRPRFELIGHVQTMQTLWQTLSPNFTAVGSHAWQRLDIEAGQPCVLAETVEMFIPQMLNLDVINGVSFKKGCYPGQEVVARLHYRGKLKRHMRIAQFTADACPPPGTPLYAVADPEGQAIGNIVLTHPIPGSATDIEFHALCVIANEAAVDNAVCLQGDTKTALKLQDLPYPFPSEG